MPVTINGVPSTNLTTGFDVVNVTGIGKDTITGEVSTNGTLNTGDTIHGNGKTTLTALLNNPGQVQPLLYLDGVNKLNLLGGGTGKSLLDATNWTDVHVIKYNATGASQTLTLTNLATTDRLKISIGDGFDGALKTGNGDNNTVDGLTVKVLFTNINYANDHKGISLRYDHGDVWFKGGLGDTATATLSESVSLASADAVLGDRTFGDIHLFTAGEGTHAGSAASLDMNLTRIAQVVGGAGDAIIGKTVFGNITFDDGPGPASGNLDIVVSASVDTGTQGNATVGDVVIGDITLNQAKGFNTESVSVTIRAGAKGTGDAVIGNVTIGNIQVNGAGSNTYLMYSQYKISADAYSGDARVGNVTFGNITVNEGPVQGYGSNSVTISISSSKGDASVGDITFGDITVHQDNYTDADAGYLSFSFYASVLGGTGTAATKGDATIGNITFGDISFVGGSNAHISSQTYEFNAYAKGDSGKATIGNVTFGDVSVDMGRKGTWEWDLTLKASQTETSHQTYGGSHIGAVTLGDISLKAGYDATFMYSNTVSAEHGKVDAYVMGDLTVVTGDKASINFTQYLYGGSIGKVRMGDLKVDMGYDGQMNYNLTVSATGTAAKWGSISSVVIGDIDVKVGDGGTFTAFSLYADAARNIGKVVIGDINLTATGTGAIGLFGSFDASNRLGAATIGDVSLKGLDGGKATATISLSGDQGCAVKNGITVGDINCFANGDGTASFSLRVSSTKGDIGDITIGDITSRLVDKATGQIYIYATGDDLAGQDAGGITVGDVRLVARGGDIWNEATFMVTSVDTAGDISIGDVRLVGENKGTAAGQNVTIDFNVTLQADGNGSITIGDVVLRNVNAGVALTANQANSIGIDISATGGSHDVTIGDVKVVGGWAISANALGDDLSDLEVALNITTTGKVTIGNVDYSKYLGDATIGDSSQEWHGMGIIKGAKGDNQIYDTEEQNIIYLQGGDDIIQFNDVQTFDFKDMTKIDTVYGFSKVHDDLDIQTSGSTYFRGGSYSDYDAFLEAAQASIKSGNDAFIGSVGADGFVALDNNNDGVMDAAIWVVGVSKLDTGDLL